MVKYISGSSGKEILFNSYEIGIGTGNPYFTKWKYDGVQKQFGTEITQFSKDPISFPIIFKFRGSKKDIKENKNSFFEECERDILNKTPGIFVVNDWNIQGYFIERETNPSEMFYGDEMSTTFFAPYPFWTRDIKRQFFALNDSEGRAGLDFPTDFPINFATDPDEYTRWYVDHYIDSNFLMTFYGPSENPVVYINEYPYQIYTSLQEGEYLTIDSRSHEVKKYSIDGAEENIYNSRAFEKSVFKKIPNGLLQFEWDKTFGFDITLFLERSEPKW